MIELLLIVFQALLCAFVAHEVIRVANVHVRDLDMSPNIGAFIALLFGVSGLIGLALYGAIKVMLKRIIKH